MRPRRCFYGCCCSLSSCYHHTFMITFITLWCSHIRRQQHRLTDPFPHTHTHTKCLPPSLFFFETYLKFEWMVMVLAGMDIAYTVSALRVAVWHGLDARDNGRWLQRTNSAGGTLVGIRIRGRVHLLLDEIISEHHTKFVYEYERIRLKSLPRRRWQ